MDKQTENLMIILVLGATAFVLWRAYRNSMSLGSLNARAPAVSSLAQTNIIPTADALINAVWGGSGGGSNIVGNGAEYVRGPSGLIDVSTLPPI